MKMLIAMLLAASLGGCASIAPATAIALGTAVVGAGSLAVTALHDCKSDGGCKTIPMPK